MTIYNTNNKKPQITSTFSDLKNKIDRLFAEDYEIRERIWNTVWRNIEMFSDVTSDILLKEKYLSGVEE